MTFSPPPVRRLSSPSAAFAQSKKIPIGIELYSVRGELQKDMPGTVRAVAKMGYQVVEFYSPYYSWTTDQAKDVRKLLDDLGIKCLSTHNSPQAISADGMAKAVELNQIIGSKYIIVASAGKTSGADGWKAFADQMAGAAEKLRAHKHGDRLPQSSGRVETARGRRAADGHPRQEHAERRRLQLDAGTAIEVGADAVAWIKANPGRIKSIHLKDWGMAGAYDVAFGEGNVPWQPLFEAAESVGGVEYYLIEQEHAGPDGELAMAQRCLDNYKKMVK